MSRSKPNDGLRQPTNWNEADLAAKTGDLLMGGSVELRRAPVMTTPSYLGLDIKDLWVPDGWNVWAVAAVWEECAAHIEAGGRVEALHSRDGWRREEVPAVTYRSFIEHPGSANFCQRRLVPVVEEPGLFVWRSPSSWTEVEAALHLGLCERQRIGRRSSGEWVRLDRKVVAVTNDGSEQLSDFRVPIHFSSPLEWRIPTSWLIADGAWEAGLVEFSADRDAGAEWGPFLARPSTAAHDLALTQFRFRPAPMSGFFEPTEFGGPTAVGGVTGPRQAAHLGAGDWLGAVAAFATRPAPAPPLGLFAGPVLDGRPTFFGTTAQASELGYEARDSASTEDMALFTDPDLLYDDAWVQCRPRVIEDVDPEMAELEDVIGHCHLHMDTGFVRRKMTSRQRSLFDRAVKRWGDRLNEPSTQSEPEPFPDIREFASDLDGAPVDDDASVESAGGAEEHSLRAMQRIASEFLTATWPELTTELEVLALAEEVGEMARAVVKRALGQRGSSEDWTAELRREAGDVGVVLCNVASMEGFDLDTAIAERLMLLLSRDIHHDPVQPDGHEQ